MCEHYGMKQHTDEASVAAAPPSRPANEWLDGAGRALQVRPMVQIDVGRIMPIESEIYPFPWSAGNFRDSLSAGYAAWILQDRVEHQAPPGPPLGYAVMMHVLDEAHLMNLSIAAPLQGQGLGRRLLGWLTVNAQERGAVGMFLEVRPSNQVALQLYESVGFQRIGLRRNYYPNGADGREDAIVMRCALQDQVSV